MPGDRRADAGGRRRRTQRVVSGCGAVAYLRVERAGGRGWVVAVEWPGGYAETPLLDSRTVAMAEAQALAALIASGIHPRSAVRRAA